jgi:hypothetical protein
MCPDPPRTRDFPAKSTAAASRQERAEAGEDYELAMVGGGDAATARGGAEGGADEPRRRSSPARRSGRPRRHSPTEEHTPARAPE